MSASSTPLPIKRTRSCSSKDEIAPPRPALRRAVTASQSTPMISISSPTPTKKPITPTRGVMTRMSSRGKENIPPPRDDESEPVKRRRVTPDVARRPTKRERACSVASIRSEFSSMCSTPRLASDDSPFDFSSPAPETPRQLASFSSSVTITNDDEVPQSPLNPYKALKALLRLSHRDAIVGREDERKALEKYLGEAREDALYVTGPPGTGKTALVAAVTDASECRTVTVNCMGLGAPSVWDRIARGLGLGAVGEQAVTQRLVDAAQSNKLYVSASDLNELTKSLIILDELDSFMPPPPSSPTPSISHLLSKLFSLPASSANIKLVAISNTLDLTLRARLVLPHEPVVLVFKPYQAPQMSAIIRARLDAAGNGGNVAQVDKNALELLARKVDAQDGDLRTALACLGSATSLAELDAQKTQTTVKVSLKHVITALAGYKPKAAPGSAPTTTNAGSSAVARSIRAIPLQARFVLLATVVYLRKKQLSVSLSKVSLNPATLYTAYSQLLSQNSSPYPPSPETDFRDLLSTLESTGILLLSAARGKKAEIELCAGEKEVLEALVGGEGEAEVVVRRIWEKEEVRIERMRNTVLEAAKGKVEAFDREE